MSMVDMEATWREREEMERKLEIQEGIENGLSAEALVYFSTVEDRGFFRSKEDTSRGGNTVIRREALEGVEQACVGIQREIREIGNKIVDTAKLNQTENFRAVLNLSNNLSDSITQISNEIGRANKVEECYMLKDKIERLEDQLLDMGVFEKAYENMEIIPIPAITFNEAQIRMVAGIFSKSNPAVVKKLKKYIKQFYRNPIELIKQYLISSQKLLFCRPHRTNGHYTMRTGDGQIILWDTDFPAEIERKYQGKGKKKKEILCIVGNDYLVYSWSEGNPLIEYDDYIGDLQQLIRLEREIHLHVDENLSDIVMQILERSYNNIPATIEEMHEMFELLELLEVANQNIELVNLRSFYQQLRNITKTYKMPKKGIS